ncbi:Alcohol dehydrogenase zinc-binding domain protein [Xylanimonas cellulosilytica DSM 15894]|uniref:Alcohol dehydrogenase zinc-binding domain protein n=1 Tax=Xylanimonas cellulosilytica (strain DSM 15894 / JCM 12276 / CECT 5975 / KCTC 9989 / LMG 20990 / NBRC 107835 / XIL07) TaxID=446471 RepID=D1BRA1_XYLCX|nr:quinone oxidoreductase [Xylanimonas cellulosilytica]ACZ30356.1 Alcohol dehydrogenase zinc-binding domain protein [Xylanimonas cellulosilytica DSM 15894]
MRAVQAREAGGPEVLSSVELPDPAPGPGQLLVRVAAAGVNFIDTYRRAGVYPMPYPHVVGVEGAGVVEALGAGVDGFAVGDRVAWAEAPGSYAELALVGAADAVAVPAGLDLTHAAALMLQGMTAHYLVASTFEVGPGHDVLLTAGAGGVGLLATQLATARGGQVITTVSTAEKAALSSAAGARHTIDYAAMSDLATQLPAAVRELTGGEGVHVAYDGVGRSTFAASLASLRRRGMLVLFGAASGPVPPVDPQVLNRSGSLFLTRPTLGHYVATRGELEWRAREVLGAAAAGDLDVRIGATYPLADAADAHRALEGRATTGKVLLIP